MTVVIACETIKDELTAALNLVGLAHEVRWIEPGLHNYPEKLRARLQEQLDKVDADGCTRVLMALGNCGNSVLGLKTGDFELIAPRVDDCISMLIGSMKKRAEESSGGGTYFLTPGWLRGERNIWVEYQHAVDKFGEDTAEMIMEMMLGNYKYLGMLETGCYNLEDLLPEVDNMADKLKLERKIIPASVSYLCDLLTGPWDNERFLVFGANSEISSFPIDYA